MKLNIPFFQLGKNKQFVTYTQLDNMYRSSGFPHITRDDMKEIGLCRQERSTTDGRICTNQYYLEVMDSVRYTNQYYLEVMKDFVLGKNIRETLPQEFANISGKTDLQMLWSMITFGDFTKFISISQKALFGTEKLGSDYRLEASVISNVKHIDEDTVVDSSSIMIKYLHLSPEISVTEFDAVLNNIFTSFNVKTFARGNSLIVVPL